MKMYVLIKDSCPDQLAPLMAAHAALACCLENKQTEPMKERVGGPFFKVTCRVNQAEWDQAVKTSGHVRVNEATLGPEDLAAASCNRCVYDQHLRPAAWFVHCACHDFKPAKNRVCADHKFGEEDTGRVT